MTAAAAAAAAASVGGVGHGATAAWAARTYGTWHRHAAAADPELREGPEEPDPAPVTETQTQEGAEGAGPRAAR